MVETDPLPEPSAEYRQQQGLAEAQEFLGMLQQMMGIVHNSPRREAPEATELREMARDISALVKETSMQLAKAGAPGDPVGDLMRIGDYPGAGEAAEAQARHHLAQLAGWLAQLHELESNRPAPLPAGTNLVAGKAPALAPAAAADYYQDFMAAHPAAHRLVASQRLQWLIEAGHDGAKAHLAMLTAIVEYGDKLFPPIPDMRIRPPAGSPYLPVYDKVKRVLEVFENNKVRVNLLNPARLSALIETEREASIRDIIAGMQTMFNLKKDAPRIAAELRDAFETFIWKEFAPGPESAALLEQIRAALQAAGVPYSDARANLLLNPHLDPARCIADLAAGLDQAGQIQAQCLATATRIRQGINDYFQAALKARAAGLYAELGGNQAMYAVELISVGNMADATGIALTSGNKHGTPDYIALLNSGYEGQVDFDAQHQPYFASSVADPDGTLVYRHGYRAATGQGIGTALLIQTVRMDTDRHYGTPPRVAVTIPAAAEVPPIAIHFHKKGEKQLVPELDAATLPAGVVFDPETGLLDLGPVYANGEPFALEVSVRSRDPVGHWEDFALLVSQTISPRLRARAVDVFEPDRPALKPGAALLPEPVVATLAHWLRLGAALEFNELVGGGVGEFNGADLEIEHRLDRQAGHGTIHVAIRAYTDAQPVNRYKFISAQDANGNVGCSQDRALAAAMWLTDALRQACAEDDGLAEGLQELGSQLQLKVIQQPSRGTGKLQPLPGAPRPAAP